MVLPNRVAVRPSEEPGAELAEESNSFPLQNRSPAQGQRQQELRAVANIVDLEVAHSPESPEEDQGNYDVADLFREFPDDEACFLYITRQLWPAELVGCVRCGVRRKHYRVMGRKAYACSRCGHHLHPLARTIFSRSKTSLRTWFYILYLSLATRGKITAKQIQRETGITYKTAWRARAQIQRLMFDDSSSL